MSKRKFFKTPIYPQFYKNVTVVKPRKIILSQRSVLANDFVNLPNNGQQLIINESLLKANMKATFL